MDSVLLAATLLGLLLSLVIFIALRFAMSRDEARRPGRKREVAAYCSDCGAALTTFSRQDGFNSTTGAPKMRTVIACPDWDPSRRIMTGTFAGIIAEGNTCGKTVVTGYGRGATTHVGHLPGFVEADCPACLEDMIAEGIITRDDAAKRLG